MTPPSSRPGGRWFDLLAMLAIGVVVVGAALIPAVTANSGGTITIRGDVTAEGRPVPFITVGFWSPDSRTRFTPTRTDAAGRFTLDVPATVDGFAYAGVPPDADHAIVTVGDAQLVRGIIGAKAATPISTPLYQGWTAATGRRLASGAAQLHFLLRAPGRIAGTSPVPPAELTGAQVRRFDGSVVESLRLDAKGRFRSVPLAPGVYGVTLVPKAPRLPVATTTTVRAGTTTTVVLAAPVPGATVSGTVRTDDGAAASAVPVLLERAGATVASATTAADGGWSVAGIAPGEYTVEVGRYRPQPVAAPSDAPPPTPTPAVPVPGRTSTPTAVPTPDPSPSPEPTTPALAALAPAERTADSVLPSSIPVEVPEAPGLVAVPTTVEAAGRVSGVVTGTGSAGAEVVVEDPATGRILRRTIASSAGAYRFGGLVQGTQYEVLAVSRPADPGQSLTGATSALATASTVHVDVELDRSAPALRGTVRGATGGTVTAGDPALLQRRGAIGADGAYLLQGLVPGAYPAVVTADGRVASRPVAAIVPADGADAGGVALDLRPGALPARVRGRFISGGAGVPVVSGTATDTDGDVIRFGPRATAGEVVVAEANPGDYTFDEDGFQGTVPAVDGPWFFLAPTGPFTLGDGARTDLGPIVLHVRAR